MNRKAPIISFILGSVGFLAPSCSTLTKSAQHVSVSENAFSVDVTKYTAAAPAMKSLIVLPPTGGTNFVDKSYAKTFCEAGYDVYVLNDWPRPGETGDDLERHQRAYSNSQRAIRIVLKEIKTPFIGMLGTSLGATYASVAANTFASIDAVFLVVGGVPIPEVIATSDQKEMRAFHASRFKRYGFKNDQEYIRAIDRVFDLEPTKLGALHDKKDIGVVIATRDTTVPFATQKTLVDFFHPGANITLNNGHVWAIVKTWLFHTKELVSFFDESANRKKIGG